MIIIIIESTRIRKRKDTERLMNAMYILTYVYVPKSISFVLELHSSQKVAEKCQKNKCKSTTPYNSRLLLYI